MPQDLRTGPLAAQMPGWLFSSLRGYQRTWLRGDPIAA
jgi:hypothetical protein